MNLEKLKNNFQHILIATFVVIIFFPCCLMIFGDKSLFSLAEKRTLADFPSAPENVSQVQGFFSDIDQYLNDHFGSREWMVTRYQIEVRKRFDETVNVTKVLKGLNNWYFYIGEKMLEDFTGKHLMSDDALNRWITSYKEKRQWLEKKGIRYLFIVPPNKISVYSEFVGNHLSTTQGVRRLNQIQNQLSDSESSSLLDLTPVLRKNRYLETLYYKSDTHWTPYGAFFAYQSIVEKIEEMFPNILFKQDFSFTPVITRKCEVKKNRCGGLTDMLLDYDSFHETYRNVEKFYGCAQRQPLNYQLNNSSNGYQELSFRTKCQQRKLKALVFRDSFFNLLVPYFSENFREVIYVWSDYDQNTVEELLSTFQPDIIIEERVERML